MRGRHEHVPLALSPAIYESVYRFTAEVSCRYPSGPWGKVLRAYYCQGRPQIGSAVEPRRLKTAHGDYLLIGRDTCPDKYIEEVNVR